MPMSLSDLADVLKGQIRGSLPRTLTPPPEVGMSVQYAAQYPNLMTEDPGPTQDSPPVNRDYMKARPEQNALREEPKAAELTPCYLSVRWLLGSLEVELSSIVKALELLSFLRVSEPLDGATVYIRPREMANKVPLSSRTIRLDDSIEK